jgi:hypothetical protein
LQFCWCGALYLTRGRVCYLLLLLAFVSTVMLRSESRGTHDYILLPQIQDSPNPVGQVPVFTSLSNRCTNYNPRHWVSFSSPATIRRVTVEVFDPASTWSTKCSKKSQICFTTSGLSPINSSWRQAPWDPWPEIFSNWTLAEIVLM